jgi:hemoglobin/transferrin/lactoferrin receptor protein
MVYFLRARLRASVSKGAIVAVLAASAASTGAEAQGGPTASSGVTELDAITVTADRVPSTVYDSPSTVSVTDAKEIDRKNINGPRDLAREEPGVTVGNQPARGGNTSYVIRGIGDNRVRIQIDGVKVPDFPETNIGAGTYTRDYVDFELLKQIEIIRGPSSALFGSDAIGGVVSYVTKDPSDFLNLVGKDTFLSAKVGFDTTDNSFVQTYTGAWRWGAWEGLLVYSRRDGHEIEPNTKRIEPNPVDFVSHNVLSKLIYDAGQWGRFRLTGELFYRQADIGLRTDLTTTGGTGFIPFTTVFSSVAEDTTLRPRVSFDWTAPVTWALADAVTTKVYWTKVEREELTLQERGTGSRTAPIEPDRIRFSDSDFRQTIRGTEVQFTGKRDWFGVSHLFTYGGSFDVTSSSRPRDRVETSLITGIETRTISGETYPNKNFPDTDTTQAAFYVQDIAQFGRLRVIPAVRFDYYHLKPNPDAAFANSNIGGFTISKQTETAISPKLGATFDLTDEYRLFAQYARGFRAPPYDNANFGFSNPIFGYEILPNGNLKPETSDGFEGGLRGRFSDGSSFQLSAFYNLYQDFLETRTVGTTAAGLTQFQYQNIAKVRIWGVEGKGEWVLGQGWSLFGAFAYAEGEDEETKRPLDSVDPFSGLGGVRYRHVSGWSLEVRARGAAGKDRVSDPEAIVRPPSWATADAILSYEAGPNFALNLGVYNILDRSYFLARDVAGVQISNANLELFRSPGRTVAVNAVIRW